MRSSQLQSNCTVRQNKHGLFKVIVGYVEATGVRTKAAVVEGIKPCCYLKKKKNRV